MAQYIQPNLSILPPSQLKLWEELSTTSKHFILYGGTAIALQLGHRHSIDFDFFSPNNFDPEELYREIPYLKNARVVQQSTNTLTCLVERTGEVLVSFFGGLTIKQVSYPSISESNLIKIASLKDLAGTKAAVIQKRVELKDYLDIYALMTIGKLSLEEIIACGGAIYDKQFNPYITLKALCYFDNHELINLDLNIKKSLKQAVEKFNFENMPKLSTSKLGNLDEMRLDNE